MDFKKIVDNSIVILPSSLKKMVLMYKNSHYELNFKMFSKEDIQNKLYGKIDDEVKAYLLKKNIPFNQTTLYLNYISRGANLNKYKEILSIKEELINSGYLKTDKSFKELFKNKKVVIFGYSNEDLEIKNILEQLEVNNVEFYNLEKIPINLCKHSCIEFKTIDEELHNALINVIDNFDNNKIKIICEESSFLYLDVFSKKYGLKLVFSNKNLGNSIEAKNVINAYLKENRSIKDNLNKFVSENPKNKNYIKIKELDDIYEFDTLNESIKNFKNVLSTKKINEKEFENEIEVLTNIEFDPEYVYFLLNASDSFLPKIKTNNEIYDDEDKKEMLLETSIDENRLNKELADLFLKSDKLVYISYSKTSNSGEHELTNLMKNDMFSLVKSKNNDYDYSKDIAYSFFSKYNDILKKYDIKTPSYNLYKNYFSEIKEFDNKFKGIDRNDTYFRKYSYSSLDKFYKCPFMYYCINILKLNNYESNFILDYGKYAHKILEDVYDDDFDFDKRSEELLNQYEFSQKDKMFIKGLNANLKHATELIKERKEGVKEHSFCAYSEKSIEFEINETVGFKGQIDSLIEIEDKYLVIVDYKTGHFDKFDSRYLEYGIAIQLPSYQYLISKTDEFKNKETIGMYVQPIVIKGLNNINSKKYVENFKLNGITIDNYNLIRYFDASFNTEMASRYIKSLKKNKSGGFNQHSVICTKETFESFVDDMEKLILEADQKIRNNEFDISPIKTSSVDPCRFCAYKYICFKKEKDYKEIKLNKDEEAKEDE